MFKFEQLNSYKKSKNELYDFVRLFFMDKNVLELRYREFGNGTLDIYLNTSNQDDPDRKDNNIMPKKWLEYTFDPLSKYFIPTGRVMNNLKKISFHPHNKGNIDQRLINLSFDDINGNVSITSYGENYFKSPLMSVIRRVDNEHLMFNLLQNWDQEAVENSGKEALIKELNLLWGNISNNLIKGFNEDILKSESEKLAFEENLEQSILVSKFAQNNLDSLSSIFLKTTQNQEIDYDSAAKIYTCFLKSKGLAESWILEFLNAFSENSNFEKKQLFFTLSKIYQIFADNQLDLEFIKEQKRFFATDNLNLVIIGSIQYCSSEIILLGQRTIFVGFYDENLI